MGLWRSSVGSRAGLHAGDPPIGVCDQLSFRLVQYDEHVAKRIANAGTTAYRDIEERLDGFPARPQELGVSLFDVSNQDVCFRADTEMHT